MREWKTQHHNVRVENAGVKIAGIGVLWKANIFSGRQLRYVRYML